MQSYNRRTLIRYAALASAAAWLSTCASRSEPEPSRSPSDGPPILVIGAGIAGLAAARTLQQQGYRVTVLEGRDRIGGRIWTDTSLGVALDLGASWIHGTEGNPITRLSQQFQIETLPTDYDAQELYDQQGTILSDAVYEQINQEYRRLTRAFARGKTDPDTTNKTSLAEVAEQVMQARSLSGPLKQGVNWYLASNIQNDSGADLAELGLLAYGEDRAFEGDDVVFPQGYRQIVQGLAQGLEIQLNQGVRRIVYDDQGVTVTTNQGEFTGAQVIVTLPLGVLKQGSVQFSPALPSAKTQAIQRLGVGTLNKVALRFPEQFWSELPHSFGYLKETRQQAMEYFNWSHYVDAPVLVALSGGPYARSFGTIPPEQVVERVMTDLRAMFGDEIPEPVNSTVTQWHRDPFAGGSYSICPPGSSLQDCDALAEPVGDRLFFAGEATNSQYPATVHGAFLSGEREAKRILALTARSHV